MLGPHCVSEAPRFAVRSDDARLDRRPRDCAAAKSGRHARPSAAGEPMTARRDLRVPARQPNVSVRTRAQRLVVECLCGCCLHVWCHDHTLRGPTTQPRCPCCRALPAIYGDLTLS
jgi:hypothetical protein